MNHELPDELKHLSSQEDFNLILSFAITHLKGMGHQNMHLDDGLLIYIASGSDTDTKVNFLNLVKNILCEERQDWQIKTIEYLDKVYQDKELEREVMLDFEKAKAYLTLRLYPFSTFEEEAQKSFLATLAYKVNIPETYSLLSLDLPSRFRFPTLEEIDVWGKEKEQLFEIAHYSLTGKAEYIEVQQHKWDGAIFYTLFDRDYSAAYCIDFGNNCNNLIGEKGSLVSFPTRGSVFIHPISNKEQFNIGYNQLAQKTNKFFDDDPGPISRNIYWFYENAFIPFEMTWYNGQLTYSVPQELLNLLG